MAHLKGMLAITKYANRSESTLLEWKITLKFPVTKLPGSNIWESDTEMIDEWRREELKKSLQETQRPDVAEKVKRPGLGKVMNRGR